MIIGLTGIIGCGKGTIAKLLVEKGFVYSSLSDVIRDEISSKNEVITRERLTRTAKELRNKGGPGIFAKMLISKLDSNKNLIVDSFRHPDEIKLFKKTFNNFLLINVSAPLPVCLNRIITRNRENDPRTLDELKAQLDKENNDNNQRMNDTINLADITIENDSTLEELKNKISSLLKEKGYR